MNRALFLDRDGIVIEDVSYPHKPADLHIREDLIPHLKKARKRGFKLIIVTNQAGIARGKFTLEQYESFQDLVNRELEKRGVTPDAVYYCPYHEKGIVEPYNRASEDRKPRPGMFLKAQKDFDLDLSRSFMVGDKSSDRIELPQLRCYILQSPYTEAQGDRDTYESFEALFEEMEHEL
ncbi:MAG: HAD family hydrolase [Spirochaetales bacterium]|nr:HAD family hydrolase [Spirochaetales bacterium]